jgi:hypothetical protein
LTTLEGKEYKNNPSRNIGAAIGANNMNLIFFSFNVYPQKKIVLREVPTASSQRLAVQSSPKGEQSVPNPTERKTNRDYYLTP